VVLEIRAPGFPAATHPAEPDLFSRQRAMPGHDQQRLEAAHILVVGCGGLGSWTAMALARMGVRRLTLVDPDHFDRTNAPRQLMVPDDLGQPKAHALARHVAGHMLNAGSVTSIARGFPEALALIREAPSALIAGVDNNQARLAVAQYARQHAVPSVFAMLSTDGLRAQALLQHPGGPCLSCLLPNLDPEQAAPCAAASMPSCLLIGAHAVFMLTSWIMGMTNMPTWREASLDGTTERVGHPRRQLECPNCGAA
jgi:adenylyltransferase/sulfurtransferase